MNTRTLIAIAAVLFLGAALLAQNPYGRITGRVTDSSGAVVPGTAIRAVNVETNVATAAVSNGEGNYELTNLNPGLYRVETHLSGFKQYSRGPIEVHVGDVLDIPIQMEVGQLTEKVTVTAEAPMLESTTASLGQLVDNRSIIELPLAGGNPMYLTQLSGGVFSATSPGHGWLPQAVGPTSNAIVAGTANGSSEFLIDGMTNMGRGGQIAFSPPPEMVQEFKVETAPFDASVGHFTGASINLVMKSGANAFHGNLFFSHCSRPLMTKTFFVNRSIYDLNFGPVTQEKIDKNWPPVRTNRYRATFSGPVEIPKVYDGRNKTFWTFGFDWLDRARPEPSSWTVPTAKEKQGDFSELLAINSSYQIYNPFTIANAGNGHFSRDKFANNVIPSSLLDPIAKKLMAYYPSPNMSGSDDGHNNYFDPRVRTIDYKSQMVRIDHQVNQSNRFYLSFSRYTDEEYALNFFHNASQGIMLNRTHRSATFDDVFTLSPRLILDIRYGVMRLPADNGGFPGFDLASLGFPASLVSQLDPKMTGFPIITFDVGAQLGARNLALTRNTNHILSGTLSQLRGNHSLRAGAEFRVYFGNDVSMGDVSPAIDFGNGWTRGPYENSTASLIGQGWASLLVGIPTGGGIDRNDTLATVGKYVALFLQDDWKVTPRLTVNLGLRWEAELSLTERYNRMNRGYDFNTPNPVQAAAQVNYTKTPLTEIPASQFKTMGGILFAGVNGVSRAVRDGDYNNFSPRIGLAYRLKSNTVVRAGYGVYFDSINNDPADAYQQGYSQETTLQPSIDNGLTFRARLANPFPDPLLVASGSSLGLPTYLGRSLSFVTPAQRAAYMQRWSLSIQRQVARRLVAEIGYLGNRGTGLGVAQQYSTTPNQYLSTSPERDTARNNYLTAQVTNPFYDILEFSGTSLGNANVQRQQLLSPFPQYGGLTTTLNYGSSWYHALLLRAEKRFSGGFTVLGSYTFSKTMQKTEKLNPGDDYLQKVIAAIDRPHNFTANGTYELPFGKGRRWLARTPGWMDHIFGGWSVQGIYMAHSGAPLNWGNIIFRGDIKDIPLPRDQRSVQRWFNIDAGFERNNAKALVSNVRTFPLRFSGIRDSGVNNFDMSAFKTFRLREGLKLQLRAEGQNAANHPVFPQAPVVAPANTQFGQITATGGDAEQRRITMGLKLMW